MQLPSGLSTYDYSQRASSKGWSTGWPNCANGNNLLTVETRFGARIPMHQTLAPLVDTLLEVMESRGYNAVNGWCWGYSCRAISGTSTPSNHSWGLAFDLNAPENPYTSSGVHDIPDSVFALFRAYGFGVGADYNGKKDWMHFEFMGTPADAILMTALAVRAFVSPASPGPVITRPPIPDPQIPTPAPLPVEDDLLMALSQYDQENVRNGVVNTNVVVTNTAAKVDQLIALLSVPGQPFGYPEATHNAVGVVIGMVGAQSVAAGKIDVAELANQIKDHLAPEIAAELGRKLSA